MKTVAIAAKAPETRNEIARALGHDEFRYARFSTGLAVIDFIRCNPEVNVAVVDNELEDADGRTIVKRVRDELGLVDLPVIIVSEMVKMRDIGEFLDLGASYFVPKPIKPDLLKRYVLTLVTKAD